ncbi:PorT family protein [Prolixibacteraceae bacterium JC049]|nr:PorT family protein [Prolixibacteraceae bacterium JC049]
MRWILILIVSFVFVSQAKAQRFSGGVLGGITASQVEGDKYSGFHRLGVTGGMWVRFPVSDKWGLQGEIKYTQKGSKRNPKPKKGDYTSYSMATHYVELPLLLRYETQKRFSLLGGVTAGYLIGSKEKDEYGVIDESLIKESIKKIDIAVTAGVEVALIPKLSLDLRWAYSLLPIRDLKGDGPYWFDGGQHNQWLSTTLYYEIDWP